MVLRHIVPDHILNFPVQDLADLSERLARNDDLTIRIFLLQRDTPH